MFFWCAQFFGVQNGAVPVAKATHNESYMANNQLAQWNGEGKTVNASYKTNFLKTGTNVWVKGARPVGIQHPL